MFDSVPFVFFSTMVFVQMILAAMEEIYAWDGTDRVENFHLVLGLVMAFTSSQDRIFVNETPSGDLLKVEILDLQPRPNGQQDLRLKCRCCLVWISCARPKSDGTDFTAGTFTERQWRQRRIRNDL
jgi:hypothetical protein